MTLHMDRVLAGQKGGKSRSQRKRAARAAFRRQRAGK